jgi:hypothetical protein
MEKAMKKSKLPRTDSVQELAKFWDSHDLTDFEDELEEEGEPVFVRRCAIQIQLAPRDAAAVKKLARAKGVSQEELVRSWVQQQLVRGNGHGERNRRAGAKTRK